jgi:hypothetical protein
MGKSIFMQINQCHIEILPHKRFQSITGNASGTGNINTTYATESSQFWERQGYIVFVPVNLHLKNINTFSSVNIGSNFPLSIGNNYCISSVCKNDTPLYAFLRVDSHGTLSIQTRGTSFGTSAETIAGSLMYVAQ